MHTLDVTKVSKAHAQKLKTLFAAAEDANDPGLKIKSGTYTYIQQEDLSVNKTLVVVAASGNQTCRHI